MKAALQAGLEPDFAPVFYALKHKIASAYNAYIWEQTHNDLRVQLDFIHNALTHMLSQSPLLNIPCSQTVLCQWLEKNISILSITKKKNLAILCAKQGYANALGVLISNGVNANFLDREEQKTLLFHAIENNHVDAVRILIYHQASIELTDAYNKNALIWACECNAVESLEALMYPFQGLHEINPNAVACIKAADTQNNTALQYAAKNNNLKAIELLIIAGADLNVRGNQQGAPILHAAKNNNFKAIELLVTAGANVNAHDVFLHTPLLYVSENNNLEAMRLLIEAGADVNVKDMFNETPLLHVVENNSVEALELLSKAQVDLNMPMDCEKTALMIASQNNAFVAMKWLVATGVDLDMQDENGDTALVYCIAEGHTDCFQYLIEAGSDASIVSFSGKSVLDYAIDSECTGIIEILLSKKMLSHSLLSKSIKYAVELGKHHLVTNLFIQDVAKFMVHQDSAMILWAAKHGCLEAVKALHEAGSRLDAVDTQGCTVLMYAMQSNNPQLIQYLATFGVSQPPVSFHAPYHDLSRIGSDTSQLSSESNKIIRRLMTRKRSESFCSDDENVKKSQKKG